LCARPVGDFLGQLKNELPLDRWITDFVSTGPKSYAFRTNDGRVTCKFKGISKTLYNLDRINLTAMLRCLWSKRPAVAASDDDHDHDDDGDDPMTPSTPPSTPRVPSDCGAESSGSDTEVELDLPRDPANDHPKNLVFRANRFGEVRTQYQAKAWDVVYDKRWIDWNSMKTYPFGY
jgi:hypothetical protein